MQVMHAYNFEVAMHHTGNACYIPSSNLFFCGYIILLYEVIMGKYRASMDPFWDLNISKYVEYLTCISSKYFVSSASVLPSLVITAG
jgi:hypothetical protein